MLIQKHKTVMTTQLTRKSVEVDKSRRVDFYEAKNSSVVHIVWQPGAGGRHGGYHIGQGVISTDTGKISDVQQSLY